MFSVAEIVSELIASSRNNPSQFQTWLRVK